jgi:two-component system, OmpR family, alkaline phosphatase synthesis response regulator PhoP
MDTPLYRILLVDDEPDILEFLSYNLRKEGFEVAVSSNGRDALQKVTNFKPHLVLLDVMMPAMDGIETCEEIRRLSNIEQPIIAFLTARGEDYSQIAGFEAGADDYINKPVKPKVLQSRIKALLKRYGVTKIDNLANIKNVKVGNIEIDRERYVVIHNGSEILMPRKELELLALLISKPDRVFTRDEIYESIWGNDVIVGDRTIDVHIRKIREKLGDEHIRTIKGVGYKFVE